MDSRMLMDGPQRLILRCRQVWMVLVAIEVKRRDSDMCDL